MDDVSDHKGPWVGRSGSTYYLAPDVAARVDGLVQVVPVLLEDQLAPGRVEGHVGRLRGLMLPLVPAASALRAVETELDALEGLTPADVPGGAPASPGRRLLDRVDEPTAGGLVDWCPSDLEQWWAGEALSTHGYRSLCLAMATVCRKVADWSVAARGDLDIGQAAPRVRPRGVLRTADGRWLLSGFGAEAIPRVTDEDGGGRTEVMIASSHFQPPEELFEAHSTQPMAALTWAIGTTFFALLKMRALLAAGRQERRAELPSGGTDSPHLGSHRSVLVADLLQRKPALFVGRPLDARQFLYPDRLPDRDRRTIADALHGLLGSGQAAVEDDLVADCLKLLDSALAIDPARRYVDPLVMAGDFEGLARRARMARSTVAAARLDAGLEDDIQAGDSSPQDPVAELAQFSPDGPTEDRSPDRAPEVPSEDSPQPAPVLNEEAAPDAGPRPATRTPAWVKGALVGLALSQVLTLGMVGLLWAGLAPQPIAAPVSEGSVSGLLQAVAADQGPPVLAPSDPTASPLGHDELARPQIADSLSSDPSGVDPVVLPPLPPDITQQEPVVAASPASPALVLAPAPAPAPATAGVAAKQAPKLAAKTVPSAPAEKAAPVEQPAAATGPTTITVTGSDAMLQGDAGRVSPGVVSPGHYAVLIRDGDSWVEAGSVSVSEGQQVLVRCGFGRCKAAN